MRDYLTLVTSESTGQPYDRVIRELSRNKWMDPKQAIEYGMIDKVGVRRAIQAPLFQHKAVRLGVMIIFPA